MAGQILELEVGDVAHGGFFVARHEGRVVFVSDAIDGERVRAVVTDDAKPGFWRASTVAVLDPSPHRVPHIWSEAEHTRDVAERPGGAEFGHIALPHQRELKARVVRDALARFAKIDREVSVEAAEGETDGLRWRTRARIHRGVDGQIGPFAERSHAAIAVQSYPLLSPALEQTALALALDTVGASIRGYDLVDTGDGVVVLPVKPTHRRGGKRPPLSAPQQISQRVGEREFVLDANGFWQVHPAAASTLTHAVHDALDSVGTLADDAWHLDLYGGVGLFAAALADGLGESARITSVESESRATQNAQTNLAAFPAADAQTGRVDRWLAQLLADASARDREQLSQGVVLLDPPRAGAGKDVVEKIVELAPYAVIYVACDPVALARDVAYFAAGGYELGSIRAFDLFPHTHHVETVAVLQARA